MSSFYVYQHIRLDNEKPFYVGKGRAKRAWDSSKRNPYWKNIVSKSGFKVEIIKDKLTESQAFDLEIETIKRFRESGLKLVNLTEGGITAVKFQKSEQEAYEALDKESQIRIFMSECLFYEEQILKRLRPNLIFLKQTYEFRAVFGNSEKNRKKFEAVKSLMALIYEDEPKTKKG